MKSVNPFKAFLSVEWEYSLKTLSNWIKFYKYRYKNVVFLVGIFQNMQHSCIKKSICH